MYFQDATTAFPQLMTESIVDDHRLEINICHQLMTYINPSKTNQYIFPTKLKLASRVSHLWTKCGQKLSERIERDGVRGRYKNTATFLN